MISNTHNDLDLETLSALFDGELQDDAARFAIKRLGHDPQWQQAFGNWQLLGDALRGQASAAAPADFAARVAAAVATERVAAAVPVAAPATAASAAPAASPARRRWLGGAALAASVAMVAMFVARPFSQDAATIPGLATPAPIELATNSKLPPTSLPAEAPPALPDAVLQISAAALTVAEVPRRASERRSRGQSQRVALRASKRQMAVPAIASVATATAVAIAQPTQHSSVNPFRPQHVEVISRPWPRAMLPASPATGAFTASFGSSAASSPSFYPFEPRLPSANDVAPAPFSPDELRP